MVMMTVIAGLLGVVALVLVWLWHVSRSLPAAFLALFLAGAAFALALMDWTGS